MKQLSEQTMRGFLRRITALQKQNAFLVETFEVVAYRFEDDVNQWLTIRCYINKNGDDTARSFEVRDDESVANNEETIKALENYLNEV